VGGENFLFTQRQGSQVLFSGDGLDGHVVVSSG
jgi:hypothetical protein